MELEILTLNCWGLLIVSKQRASRMRLVGEWLQKSTADLVFLQEVWIRADAEALTRFAAEGQLKYAHHFVAGVFGSGLVTLSKYPIQQAQLLDYSAVGDPLAVLSGDFYAGKGVGWARLSCSDMELDCFNTHLSASYGNQWQADKAVSSVRVPKDDNSGVRTAQILQLTAFVNSHTPKGNPPVILAGDLNSPPDSLEVQLLQQLVPALSDCWATANSVEKLGECTDAHAGATANTADNSFGGTAGQGKEPVRIDYIWCSGHSGITSCQVLAERSPQGVSFSDHNALAATISFNGSLDGQSEGREDGRGQKRVVGGASGSAGVKEPGEAEPDLRTHIFKLALQVLSSGAHTMRLRAIRGGTLCVILLVAAVVLLAILLSYPWWHFHRQLYVVLQLMFAAASLGLPFTFLMGWGARHAQSQALKQACTEMRLWSHL